MMIQVPCYDQVPSYDHFLKNHLLTNTPALFGPALTQRWKARQQWVHHGQPRYDYLKHQFGDAIVTVADCAQRDFTDQKRAEMSFREFVDVWQGGRYYLKDWHFVRAFPEYDAYTVPHVFKDDWMNEFWTKENKDDYRFVYMGGDGTFTPLHADVFRSYSWSSNICGVKKWTLFPPGQEQHLKDTLGNYAYDLRQVDPTRFPNAGKAVKIELWQREGQTLFVPSGWFHQVENVGATISINHNWANACNLGMTFRSLCLDLSDVEHAIDDCREGMGHDEFQRTCQHLLLLHSGWDWPVFVRMLHCITARLCGQRADPAASQPATEWQLAQIAQVLHQRNKALDHYSGLGAVIAAIETMIGNWPEGHMRCRSLV